MLRMYLEKDATCLIRSDENLNFSYIKQIFNSATVKVYYKNYKIYYKRN